MEAQRCSGGFVDISPLWPSGITTICRMHLNSDLDMTAMDIAMVWNPGPSA